MPWGTTCGTANSAYSVALNEIVILARSAQLPWRLSPEDVSLDKGFSNPHLAPTYFPAKAPSGSEPV